jgi:estrone sulfotransferase
MPLCLGGALIVRSFTRNIVWTWKQCSTCFCEGFSAYGPFWDHCLEFWRESIARPRKVLFLKYEEMLSNPVIFVIKIAAFIGVPFSAKEEEDGVPEAIVRLCSFDKLSNLHVNKTGEFYRHGNLVIENSAYFRKGKVGDWVNHMSEEMGRKLDCIVKEKLKGSSLTL